MIHYWYALGSVYTRGFDRDQQVSENQPWFTRSEYMFLLLLSFTLKVFKFWPKFTSFPTLFTRFYKALNFTMANTTKYHLNFEIAFLYLDDNWPVFTHSASLWMFTLKTTRVVSNFWEKWKIFKPSEEYGSKTYWHKKHIFWTSESWFISTSLFGPIQAKCVNAIISPSLKKKKYAIKPMLFSISKLICNNDRTRDFRSSFFYISSISSATNKDT